MRPSEVSIIMPCFNAGPYVQSAIESVLAQDIPVQLIAVNDGSTDNTLDVLAKFSSDIHVIDSKNGGVANARNQAVVHVKGRYTLLLDADDELIHTQENAELLMRNSSDFDSWVTETVSDLENFTGNK